MSLPEIGSTITWDWITTIYVYKVVDYKEIVNQLTNKPELASHLECIDIIERDEFDLEYKVKKIKGGKNASAKTPREKTSRKKPAKTSRKINC